MRRLTMAYSRLQSDETAAWIALSLARGVGGVTIRRLIEVFGTASAVWQAGGSAIADVPGVSATARGSILKGPDVSGARGVLKVISDVDGWIMTFMDEDYPEMLSATADRPAILYGKGSREALSGPCAAVVGSRAASSYGVRAAGQLAAGLASRGICVVSGLALGIDSAAHRACLKADGITVAVTGSGIDVVYPRRNKQLAAEICEKGAVITEYPPGTAPEAGHFPARNRIISGLSRGVVVVEASRRSGSLITASMALEQGREVMAVPGSIYSMKSSGTHWLIRQGAAPVTCVDDVMETLGTGADLLRIHDAAAAGRDKAAKQEITVPPGLGDKEVLLWKGLEDYPRHIDDLAASAGLSAGDAAALLIQMEIRGLVQAMPGQMYQRIIAGM